MTEETKKEDAQPVAEAKEEKVEEPKKDLDPKLEKIISAVSELTILEMADLVKAMEEKFGVSAAVAVAGGGAGGGEAAEEKSDYTIMITAAGEQKFQVIKVVREITGLGLKEAKDIVDGAPGEVKAGVPTAEAQEFKKKLEAAGATVELK